jgi:hypothetical protein
LPEFFTDFASIWSMREQEWRREARGLSGKLPEKGQNKTAGAFMLRLVVKASIAKNGSAGQQ